MPSKEFDSLFDEGIFAEINDKCDLNFDDYEEESITAAKASTALSIVSQSKNYSDGVFASILKKTIDLGTEAYCEF